MLAEAGIQCWVLDTDIVSVVMLSVSETSDQTLQRSGNGYRFFATLKMTTKGCMIAFILSPLSEMTGRLNIAWSATFILLSRA